MANTAEQTARNAERTFRNAVGMCLQQSRIWAGVNAKYPDATTAWLNTNDRHPGDRNVPRGAMAFWTGGSRGHGHVAPGLGGPGSPCRSTDADGAGQVATRTLAWFDANWPSLRYAGWAWDINEVTIPHEEEDEMGPEDWTRLRGIVADEVEKGLKANNDNVANHVWSKDMEVTKPDGSKVGKKSGQILRETWSKLSKHMTRTDVRAWFLNLGPSSTTTAEANGDINAIWETEPALLVGCEAIGKGDLPSPGSRNTKIRDTSRPGRANLFAYVKGVTDIEYKWTDCNKEFPRAERPGMHWARSILQFPFKGQQIVVAHKPPLWKGAGPARWEHDQKIVRIMNPDKDRARSRLLFWDSNGMKGAQALARRVDGWVVGDRIDNAVVRKINIVEQGYRTSVNGHKFHTDHPWGAFYLRWEPVE